MPGPLRVNSRLEIPERELRWRFSRGGGPGGQSVNTADSRVELSFDVLNSPTLPEFLRTRVIERTGQNVITVVASENRSQLKNRHAAEKRLAEILAKAVAAPPRSRRPTRPTLSAKRERVDEKKRRGDIKRARRKPSGDD